MAASRLHSMIEETGAAGAGHGSPRASQAAWRRSSGPGHLRSRRSLSPPPLGT
eukprot:SAG25_NODE_75_length_16951_cov_86.523208_2_plen_53_part_00